MIPAEQPHQSWFDSVLESLPDPILVMGPRGELVWTNRAADHLTRPCDGKVQTLNRERIGGFVAALLATDKASGSETLTLLDPIDALERPMGAVAKTATWSSGEAVVVVTLRRDAAEKTLLLANVSHEVRTPLNAILGYTSLLLHGVNGELSSKQKTSLQRIDSNAQHLLALINDLLDLSLTDAGKVPLRLTRFDLAQLLRETVGEIEPVIAETRLPVYSDWSAPVPPIVSDRRKVKQIVLNLLTNAVKFTRAGEVRLTLSATNEFAKISVADTGIGIAHTDQDKIFEDFRQVDPTFRRVRGGAGLGLAICRRFAGILGGNITVNSEIGKGATFALWLPLESHDGSKQT
jgi:signal transduction histidine kinase